MLDRVVNRGTAVAVVGHAAVLAIAVLAARGHRGSMFWLLALFCALGMVANLLAWASVRSGKVVWDLGVLTLVASLPVLVVASTRPAVPSCWCSAGPATSSTGWCSERPQDDQRTVISGR